MKRTFLAAAACLGLAVGAIGLNPTPASATVSLSFGFGFGSPFYGHPFYPGPFHPRPFMGAPMYQTYPHQVCYPVVKLRKYVRHHHVHWRKVVVTVCTWRGW